MGPCLCGDSECRRCFPNGPMDCPECDGVGEVEDAECENCNGSGLVSKEDDTRDEEYERAAARARGNDFEDTDGKDWT